jgi:hypothetical protein
MTEELRKEIYELEKHEREIISSIRMEFEYLRERVCKASGGHFFYEAVKKDHPNVVKGYVTNLERECKVCKHREILERDI